MNQNDVVEPQATTQLQGLAVVEIAGSMAGGYCAKLFADGGADVTVVGHGDLTAHQRIYLHRHVRTANRLAEIDLATADVLIESAAPDPVVPIMADHGQLVRVQISPLGSRGERVSWKSTALTDYAMSGHGFLNGVSEREPLGGAPSLPAVAAGIHGFIGALAALLAKNQLGHGQTVEISHLGVMISLHQTALVRTLCSSVSPTRTGGSISAAGHPNGLYQCSDGWVSVAVATAPQVDGLRAATGLSVESDDTDSSEGERFISWCATRQVIEVVELLQLVRVPAAPVLAPVDLLDDPQLRSRAFFESTEPSHGAVMVPGSPASIVLHHQQAGGQRWTPGPRAGGPLVGLKVLDLSRVWAGPLAARMLRDLGAEVIAVEAPNQRGPRSVPDVYAQTSGFFPDNDPGDQPWNRNIHLTKFALGKQSLAVDLQTDDGRSVLARLVGRTHVLIENFSTRVMPQLGFGENRLRELNPDLIYLTMSAYGRTGPNKDWVGYGSTVDAHAGLSRMVGYLDGAPLRGGTAWPDAIAALHSVGSVLSCLWHGQRSTSYGATIEVSQLESMVAALGDQLVTDQFEGTQPPIGNRHIDFLAQGVYRCRGVDQWIAVSVPDVATLSALRSVAGMAINLGRANHLDPDRFDRALAAFAAQHDADNLAICLQAAGVPAAKISSPADVLQDPHLVSHGAWVTIDQPHLGTLTVPDFPIGFSRSRLPALAQAPLLGEHNQQVLLDAGFSTGEASAFAASGVIASAPPA